MLRIAKIVIIYKNNIHLFPVNSGNSARSLEIVQSIFDNTA